MIELMNVGAHNGYKKVEIKFFYNDFYGWEYLSYKRIQKSSPEEIEGIIKALLEKLVLSSHKEMIDKALKKGLEEFNKTLEQYNVMNEDPECDPKFIEANIADILEEEYNGDE